MKLPAWIVFRKEVLENVRDRRTLGSALIYGPLFGPLMIALMLFFMIDAIKERSEKPLKLPLAGAEHAPMLVAFLREKGVILKDAPGDPAAAVLAQDEDVVVVIPPDYGTRWRAGEPARVFVYQDSSRRQAMVNVGRARALLEAYSGRVGAQRLQVRGVHPLVARPLATVDRDQATAQSRGSMLFGSLPFFFVFSVFMGGLYLAIDTTAGERERQSLEPLLVNPVSRAQILAGKLAATVAFSLVSLLITLVAFAISSRFMPLDELGMRMDFSARTVLLLFIAIAPFALVASSLQTLVAAFAKSFREAQTYVQLLMFVPMVPSFVLMANPLKPEAWMYATPMLGQFLVAEKLVRGEAVSWQAMGLCVVGTLLAGLLLAWFTARIYRRESLAISA